MTFILTNSAHAFPASTAGAVSSYSGSGTVIEVYEGDTALAYDGTGTSDSTWKSVETATNITVGSKTDSGAYLTVGDHSGVANGTDASKIIYTENWFHELKSSQNNLDISNPIIITSHGHRTRLHLDTK